MKEKVEDSYALTALPVTYVTDLIQSHQTESVENEIKET